MESKGGAAGAAQASSGRASRRCVIARVCDTSRVTSVDVALSRWIRHVMSCTAAAGCLGVVASLAITRIWDATHPAPPRPTPYPRTLPRPSRPAPPHPAPARLAPPHARRTPCEGGGGSRLLG